MKNAIKADLKTAGVKKKVADLHALQQTWRAAEKNGDNKATRAGLAAAIASMRAESKDNGDLAARSTVNADGTVTDEPAITVTVVLPADETVKIQNELLTGLVGTVDPTAVLGADEIGDYGTPQTVEVCDGACQMAHACESWQYERAWVRKACEDTCYDPADPGGCECRDSVDLRDEETCAAYSLMHLSSPTRSLKASSKAASPPLA